MGAIRGITRGRSRGRSRGITRSSGADPQTTLTVAITDSTDPVITLVNFDYELVVTNTGAEDALNVEAVVTLDAQLTYVSGSGTGWTVDHDAGVVTCTLDDDLEPGAAPTVTITVTSPAAAETSSTTADAVADNAPAATQDSETTVVNLVAQDATSLKRVPASAAEWTNFNAYHVAIGTANFPNVAPSALHLCQEASGNLADTLAGGLTLTAAGTPLYQQAVVGWTRTAASMDTGSTDAFGTTSSALPDIATESLMTLAYVKFPAVAPAGTRNIMCLGVVGTRAATELLASDRLRARCGATNVADSAATDPTPGVRPVVTQIDSTNSVMRSATDQEILSPTFDTNAAGEQLRIGGVPTGNTSIDGGYLYLATFYLAAAEISQAGIKALLQALGWTIAW